MEAGIADCVGDLERTADLFDVTKTTESKSFENES
jgi:hypothetical protein